MRQALINEVGNAEGLLASSSVSSPGVGEHRQEPLRTPDPSLGRGKKAWLFVGCELAGKRAATVMSLVHSVNQHGHGPWRYLTDVHDRLPMHPNHRIDELLPHR